MDAVKDENLKLKSENQVSLFLETLSNFQLQSKNSNITAKQELVILCDVEIVSSL